ncbi:Protein kinase superfamily protein [Pelomyxa schiedti]|nr:Protein kinase superfamily protein [Pelomyxa schiedti]
MAQPPAPQQAATDFVIQFVAPGKQEEIQKVMPHRHDLLHGSLGLAKYNGVCYARFNSKERLVACLSDMVHNCTFEDVQYALDVPYFWKKAAPDHVLYTPTPAELAHLDALKRAALAAQSRVLPPPPPRRSLVPTIRGTQAYPVANLNPLLNSFPQHQAASPLAFNPSPTNSSAAAYYGGPAATLHNPYFFHPPPQPYYNYSRYNNYSPPPPPLVPYPFQFQAFPQPQLVVAQHQQQPSPSPPRPQSPQQAIPTADAAVHQGASTCPAPQQQVVVLMVDANNNVLRTQTPSTLPPVLQTLLQQAQAQAQPQQVHANNQNENQNQVEAGRQPHPQFQVQPPGQDSPKVAKGGQGSSVRHGQPQALSADPVAEVVAPPPVPQSANPQPVVSPHPRWVRQPEEQAPPPSSEPVVLPVQQVQVQAEEVTPHPDQQIHKDPHLVSPHHQSAAQQTEPPPSPQPVLLQVVQPEPQSQLNGSDDNHDDASAPAVVEQDDSPPFSGDLITGSSVLIVGVAAPPQQQLPQRVAAPALNAAPNPPTATWYQLPRNVRRIDRANLNFTIADTNKRGEGASGKVYQGNYNGARVAVKCYRPIQSQAELDALQQEVQNFQTCQGKNVANCYGAYISSTECLVVMDLYECSLSDMIRKTRDDLPVVLWDFHPLDLQLILWVSHLAAKGLSMVHSMRLAHGDVKSDNFLMDMHLNCYLADFGLSIHLPNPPKGLRGTNAWMAPENIIDGTVSVKTDIYSFGMLLFELVSHTYPFQKMFGNSFNDEATIKCALSKGVRPKIPNTVKATTGSPVRVPVPHKLRMLIEKCWAQEPDQRPNSMEEVDALLLDVYLDVVAPHHLARRAWIKAQDPSRLWELDPCVSWNTFQRASSCNDSVKSVLCDDQGRVTLVKLNQYYQSFSQQSSQKSC